MESPRHTLHVKSRVKTTEEGVKREARSLGAYEDLAVFPARVSFGCIPGSSSSSSSVSLLLLFILYGAKLQLMKRRGEEGASVLS